MGKKRVAPDFKHDDYFRFRVGQLVKVVPAWIFKDVDLWDGPQTLANRDIAIARITSGQLCLVIAVESFSYQVVVGDKVGWIDFNEIGDV